MHNHYIINGFVEFHPATSTLRNLKEPGNSVVLNSPAGRCLLLLITRDGKIVTQQEFMDIVWEKNGMLVSPNTFYQNISILRKGLKKVGLPEDPVVTIPRVGLTLASGTEITKRSSEKLATHSDENALFMDENFLAQEQHEDLPPVADAGESNKLPATPEAQSADNAAQTAPSDRIVQKKPRSLSLWATGLVGIILLILIAGVKDNTSINSRLYFSHYIFLAEASGCHIFIADKNATPEDKIKTLSLFEKLETNCSNYPWVYITHYLMLPRISVIRCNKPMTRTNTCISEYYFRGLNQDD